MAKNVIVRYRTRPEVAGENSRLVSAVFASLSEIQPDGFAYTTYRLADGATFVHVAHFEGDENPLAALPAFAEFQRELGDRCVDGPAPAEATIIGSYGATDDRVGQVAEDRRRT